MSLLSTVRRTKPSGLSRRALFRNGGLMAAAGLRVKRRGRSEALRRYRHVPVDRRPSGHQL